MKQFLLHLMDLQKIDMELQRLEALKGDLPEQVDRLGRELMEAQNRLTADRERLLMFQKEKAKTDLEIKAFEGKKARYEQQLYEVKNNREYDAVTLQIEAVKNEIDKKESRLLELEEVEEGLKKGIAEQEAALHSLEEDLGERKARLEVRIRETEAEETALRVRRGILVQKIPSRLVSTYDRIRNAKAGVGVVPVVRGGCCGGCFKQLPPQRVMEIRDMERLILCEVCGRILVWDEEVYASSQSEAV